MGRKLNPAKIPAGKLATVTLNAETLKTEWGSQSIEVGKRFKVTREGEKPYYFVASVIEPTAPDSDYAWVTGERVNARGVRIESQITHRHCREGERMELIHVGMVG